MEIKLFANLADIAETRVIEIDEDVDHVGAVLDLLCEEQPSLRDALFDEENDLLAHINVLVDGASIHHTGDGLNTSVDKDSEIAIFPPVSGGYPST